MNLDLSHLHHVILKPIVLNGYAPSIEILGEVFQRFNEDVIQCLKDLEEYHGVVLHPKTSEVWDIHPFSLSPTNFWVKSQQGQWRGGNCAWCSLGIAAVIKKDVTITTTLGGEDQQIKIEIINDQVITGRPLFIHFPIAMRNAWDNVMFTCNVMQIFFSHIEVDDWCQRHNFCKGDVHPIDNMWNFAKIWYGNHLHEDWKKWTSEQARSIFKQFNLVGSMWQIPSTNSRF